MADYLPPPEYVALFIAAVDAALRSIEARRDGREPDPADQRLLAFAKRRLPELRTGITAVAPTRH